MNTKNPNNERLAEALKGLITDCPSDNIEQTADRFLPLALVGLHAELERIANALENGKEPRLVADESTDPPTFTSLEPELHAAELREQVNFWRGVAEDRKLVAEGYRELIQEFKDQSEREKKQKTYFIDKSDHLEKQVNVLLAEKESRAAKE